MRIATYLHAAPMQCQLVHGVLPCGDQCIHETGCGRWVLLHPLHYGLRRGDSLEEDVLNSLSLGQQNY